MTTVQTLVFEAPGQEEERGRADLYGTLATLFCRPPSQDLLDRIAGAAHSEGSLLDDAWQELAVIAGRTDAEAVRQEYEDLFIGVGKPAVMLYGSYYLAGFLMEKPLVVLRTDLAQLGLQRPETVAESEDHLAMLCEVMRYLITSDDVMHPALPVQKKFFADHLQPWVDKFCATLEAHPGALFYAAAARFARRFFEIEAQAFDMFG